MPMNDEEIRKLTDEQLFDKITVVSENGFSNEQDSTYVGTPAHQELLGLYRRLCLESNRRLAQEAREGRRF